MSQFHPESADLSPEEFSRLRFLADFRMSLHGNAATKIREIYQTHYAKPEDKAAADEEYARPRRLELQSAMESEPMFQSWSALLRSSQDLLWHEVGGAVDRDLERLKARYRGIGNRAFGSVTLNPDLEFPDYIADADTHRMPGSYQLDRDLVDVRAGALYDIGGVIYQLGLGNNKGHMLNDSRGRTLVAHMRSFYPDFHPTRILDMGCGVGHNTIPLTQGFPDAEVHGLDVGAALLRYAHLRSEGLGGKIHFHQENAEKTTFADDAFDLVVSQIILHETSPEAMKNILAESFRIVKPGGVVVHLEVPIRYDNLNVFEQFFRSWEQYYNVEPNIEGVGIANFNGLMADVGFEKVMSGFQAIPVPGPDIAATKFSVEPEAGFGKTWFIVSGTKPPRS